MEYSKDLGVQELSILDLCYKGNLLVQYAAHPELYSHRNTFFLRFVSVVSSEYQGLKGTGIKKVRMSEEQH